MLEGKTFLGATGMPILKIARVKTRLAVWLPEPLTVAAWIVRSLIICSVNSSLGRRITDFTRLLGRTSIRLESSICEGRRPQGDRGRGAPGGARPRHGDEADRGRPGGRHRGRRGRRCVSP